MSQPTTRQTPGTKNPYAPGYQGMPRLSAPMVNPDLTVAATWDRFFQVVWFKLFDQTPIHMSLNTVAQFAQNSIAAVEAGLQEQITAQVATINALNAQVAALQAQLQAQLDAWTLASVSPGGAMPTNTVGFLNVSQAGAGSFRIPLV